MIPPDATSIVTSVNFTTTRAGMTSQLLAVALKHEKPELEVRKSELLKAEEEHKMEIGRLEDFLLEELANASGNLLENKELLASLNETKAKSATIKVSTNFYVISIFTLNYGATKMVRCHELKASQIQTTPAPQIFLKKN